MEQEEIPIFVITTAGYSPKTRYTSLLNSSYHTKKISPSPAKSIINILINTIQEDRISLYITSVMVQEEISMWDLQKEETVILSGGETKHNSISEIHSETLKNFPMYFLSYLERSIERRCLYEVTV
jgi:hypothetical protein